MQLFRWDCIRDRLLLGLEARLLSELPTLFCVLGCPAGSYLGGLVVHALGLAEPLSSAQMFGCLAGTGAGGLLGGFLGRQTQVPSLGRYLRRVVDDLTSRIS